LAGKLYERRGAGEGLHFDGSRGGGGEPLRRGQVMAPERVLQLVACVSLQLLKLSTSTHSPAFADCVLLCTDP
jgi:hypothetical protein